MDLAAARAIRAARWIGMRQKNGVGRFTSEIRVRKASVYLSLAFNRTPTAPVAPYEGTHNVYYVK